MKPLADGLLLAVGSLLAASCGGAPADLSLNVTWTFLSGDCTSNSVTTVRVSWAASGEATREVEFACSAGGGKLGDLSPSGGTYTISAEGLDSAGIARVTHFGTSLTVSPGTGSSARNGGNAVELTLRPKPANVVVTWSMGSGAGGCPPGVVLPYFIGLYNPPATAGGPLTSKVKETQESCSKGTATLTSVAPGNYVVELDSRAVNPVVRARKDVTVSPGQAAPVDFQL